MVFSINTFYSSHHELHNVTLERRIVDVGDTILQSQRLAQILDPMVIDGSQMGRREVIQGSGSFLLGIECHPGTN